MLTQCRLYRETTGDDTYAEMEASLRDWLFGCNPWGTSMIVELPLYGDYPSQPHSSLLNAGVGNTTGGLVDGPVYRTIFESLRGVNMTGIPRNSRTRLRTLPARPDGISRRHPRLFHQ